MGVVSRFDVFLVQLDPTKGSEIKKTRPSLIISPDEQNKHLNTIIVAPMTTTIREYPTRVSVNFAGKEGQIALDQIRCIDKSRLIKKIGRVHLQVAQRVSATLIEMFTL